MTLREDLTSGASGLLWQTPTDFQWAHDDPRAVVAHDATHKVTWLVRLFRFRFDLQRKNDATLRNDLERDARHLFDAAHAAQSPSATEPPRTTEPTWSPIVEVDQVGVGLRVVRRVTYQPGNELIAGSVAIPLSGGYAEISAVARSTMTGMRESILVDKLCPNLGEPGFEPLRQSALDDPQYDALFADHPLSLVRGALRWLSDESGMRVVAPAPPTEEGEVSLRASGCAVTPPPRYLLLPPDWLPMSPTLSSFSRVTFGDAPPRLLDVWRFPETITSGRREDRLVALVRDNADGWAREGATDLMHDVRIASGESGRVEASAFIRFRVQGRPKTNAARWRLESDGTIFRVGVSAKPHVSPASMREDANATMASLRRLELA